MTRLLALGALIVACLILPSTAFADAQSSRVAFWRLGEQSVFDDFSTLDAWTFDAGAGTLSASGGQLVPSSTSEKRLHLTSGTFGDAQGTLAFRTGSSVPSTGVGVVLRRLDASNYLLGNLNPSGGLSIWKVDGGTFTNLAPQTRPALATNTQYWVRFSAVGDSLTLTVYSADPAGGGSPLTTTTHTLTGANATKFGAGISAQAGIRTDSVPTDYRYDSFQLDPLRAADSKGSNHGTYTGGFTLGQTGATTDGDKAVKLDGSTGYVTAPDASALDLGDTLSIEAWFKRSSTSGDQTLVGKGQNAYVLSITGGKLTLRKGGDGNIVQSTTTPGADGTWHHVVATKDAATAKIYLDGVDVSGTVTNQTLSNSSDPLNIGTNLAADSTKWNGWVDDVALYPRALTASEVRRLAVVCDKTAWPPGTPGATITTPGQLAGALSSGETGCFRAGTYTEESVNITTPGVTFRPFPGETATWRGRMVVKATSVTIRGLTLDGSYGPVCGNDTQCLAADQAAQPQDRCFDVYKCTFSTPVVEAPSVKIIDNDISNRRPGDSEQAGICINESNSGADANGYLIARNRIHDCGELSSSTGLPRNHDHGIYVGSGNVGNGGDIVENVIFDNADRGIQLYPNAAHVTIRHNTVDGNGEGISIGNSSHDNSVDENIVTNSTVRWNLEAPSLTGTGNSVTNTCLRASNANTYYNQDNGIEASPPFRNVVTVGTVVQAPASIYANRGAKDFRLTAGTCRDNGWGAPDSVAAP